MTPYEQINSINILEVLDALGIQYRKSPTGYDLYDNKKKERTDGRKVCVRGNYVNDFSCVRGVGEPFSFIMSHLKLSAREVFLWFHEHFGVEDIVKGSEKPIYKSLGSKKILSHKGLRGLRRTS